MKQMANITIKVFAATALGFLLALPGCTTTGMQRSAKTGAALEKVENDIKQLAVKVDSAGTALNDLIQPETPDVKK